MRGFWQASLTRNVILTLAAAMCAFWLVSEAISFYYRCQKAEAEVRDDLVWELKRVSQEEHRLYELAQIRVNTLLRLWSDLLSGARLSKTLREPSSQTVFVPFAGVTLDDDTVAAVGQVLEVFGQADPQSPVTTFLKVPGQGVFFYRATPLQPAATAGASQAIIRQRFGVPFEEPALEVHSLSRSVVTARERGSGVVAGQALNINRMGEHRSEFSYLLRDESGTVLWSDLGVGAEANALQALVPGCPPEATALAGFIVACVVLEDTHLQMLALAPEDLALSQVLSLLTSTAPWTLLAQVLLLMVIALILHRRLGRPLRHIVAIIHRQQRSTDLSVRLPERRKDELGRIARAYNALLTNLNAYHQTLEDKVNERTRELSVAKRMAEKANDRKSEHLTSVSHEIRTPLNGIVGALSLLERGDLSAPQQQELIATALQSSAFLLSIINNLLDFSRIEAGQLQLSCERTDVLALLDQALLTVNLRAQEKQLQLQVLVMADVPAFVCLDGIRVQQILVNLLANAVKFTAAGGVYVQVAQQDGMLSITVRDTGRGIPPVQQQDIFKPFSQVRIHDSGSGLGLAIASRLARLMGGNIDLRSQPGEGAVFAVHLPIHEPLEAAPLPVSRLVAPLRLHPQLALWGIVAQAGACAPLDMPELAYLPGRLRQKISAIGRDEPVPQEASARVAPCPWSLQVLIVDDLPINREIVGKMLTVLGHRVHGASGGHEALACGREQVFDLVLMDIRMPLMDGFEVARQWREERSGMLEPAVPIWALTADALPSEQCRARAAGMNGYLAKPVSLEQLAAALNQAVALLLERGVELAPNPRLQQPVLNLADGVLMNKVGAALHALYADIVTAHRQREPQALLAGLHALKGCAGQAGLGLLAELAQAHEVQIGQGGWPGDKEVQDLGGLIEQSLHPHA
ncbi:two-component system secretion sensor histidine kinase SsrA [Pseudomonas sp. JAI115]|uniref:ATP-binding protein n=1 Tax=Pseudomonas sp. JAI115 TaxID=2723061 RepID=UPI00160AA644|nr:ATP-binding protein [Pseudomonas sp. JAI115]MBB6155204.1 two-component system secretion sensor histidine kinase SsrA [Pseudomonas sp. JAI115]